LAQTETKTKAFAVAYYKRKKTYALCFEKYILLGIKRKFVFFSLKRNLKTDACDSKKVEM
jgi:hypothetical protein